MLSRARGYTSDVFQFDFSTLLALMLAAAVIGIWYEGSRVRESANRIAAEICRTQSLQLLDGTVALSALRPRIDRTGLRIERTYAFDYTAESVARSSGFIIMLGHELQHVVLERGGSP